MKVFIGRFKDNKSCDVEYCYEGGEDAERPMILDVLLQAQEREHPDLAYRYGCRNGLCGVCTVDVNGKARLACRTKTREGDKVGALKSLPVIKDLVVKRDAINKQLQGKLPVINVVPEKLGMDHHALLSLNRCIECYACLQGCLTHQKNAIEGPYLYGNPYSFLRIQKVLVDPSATYKNKMQAIELARSFGIDDYTISKTPACGVGINLKKEVIKPLQKASAELNL